MPHSMSPEMESPPTQTDEQPTTQSDSKTQSQDVAMTDTASPDTMAGEKVSLEDIFNDDSDDDEEYSSSAPQTSQINREIAQSLPRAPNSIDPEIMRAFYQRLFPFRYLFQWLNHSPTPSNDFAHREFAFTLQNDAYLRYQSFPTSDLFRKQCLQLLPSRFEIGPIYTTNPRDRKALRNASAFRPIEKELVFDIDMTDYDDIRTCCTGANICHKCWSFITMAIKVVDVALREDFGYKHIMWVYSGRRGAHAWVCDKKARALDDVQRKAIAGYLELLKGGDKGGKRVNVRRPLHPHIERSLQILKDHFQTSILHEQDPWRDQKAEHLLALLPDPTLRSALQKKWDASPSRASASKWSDIDSVAKLGDLSIKPKDLVSAKQDIILEYTYPRLDAEVSKKRIHLLKSPFVIHPGTGRVCVPIDTRKVEEFDPLGVPTVAQLLNEIDEWNGEGQGEKKIADYEKTSLKPYVDYFRSFVSALLKDERGGKRDREDLAGDAMEF